MKNSLEPARYAVVGDPVAHSLSPLIHNAWMIAAGLDAHYDRVHLQSSTAAADLRAMVRDFSGLNVTLPHKRAALEAGASSSPEARIVGVANTLVRDGESWIAHIIASLNRSGAILTIANRSAVNAAALANELAPAADTAELAQLEALSASADIIVNSASLGHAGASLLQLAPGKGRPFLDLTYGKAAAPTLEAAARAGWTPHDGLTMLVGQAAAAFRLWFGIAPDQASALHACRAAVGGRA